MDNEQDYAIPIIVLIVILYAIAAIIHA